jgi:Asp-tRNA(Asn)/Glu-tRNA(Gln) amidotransferase A subunit family amidase
LSLDKARPKVDPETLVFASASVAARAISRGEITSTDLTKAILRRIEAYNPKINAIASQ